MKIFLLVCFLFLCHKSATFPLPGNVDPRIRALQRELLLQPELSNKEKAELLKEMGELYQEQDSDEGHLLRAVSAFQQAIRLYEDEEAKQFNQGDLGMDHSYQMARLYSNLADTYKYLWYATLEDKYKQPMHEAWEQSKSLYRDAMQDGHPATSLAYAMVCIYQGVYYIGIKDPFKASKLLQEAVLRPAWEEIVSIVDDEEGLQFLQKQRAMACILWAEAERSLERYDVALQAMQPALKYFQSTDDMESYAIALQMKAAFHFELGQYEQTKQSYQTAMELFQQQQQHDAIGGNSRPDPLSQENREEQEPQENGEELRGTIQNYQSALKQCIASDNEKDHGYIGGLHAKLGSLYLSTNELGLAETHLRQAIRFYTSAEGDNRGDLATTRSALTNLLDQQGKYSESAEQCILMCQLYQEMLGEGVPPNSRTGDAFRADSDANSKDSYQIFEFKANRTFFDDHEL